MTRRLLLSFLLCLVASAPALAGQYSVTPLGILPGGYLTSSATSIDNQGEVAGYSSATNGQTQAFFWTQSGGMVALGDSPVFFGSQAFGVNNGNVVGSIERQAFRWTAATGIVLLDPNNAGEANGVNPSGKVIGNRTLSGATHRAMNWSVNNTLSNPFPIQNLTAAALNGLGQYVGLNGNTAGYYNDVIGGNIVNLGVFFPTSLSDNQVVAGSKNGVAAVLDLHTNTTTSIGTLADDLTSKALGINPTGTKVVGVSNGHGGFIYDVATTIGTNLTSALDPAFSGWTILSANSINDNGQIVGIGQFGDVQQAVLLNPVPEPSSLALAAIGALALLAYPKLRTRAIRGERAC